MGGKSDELVQGNVQIELLVQERGGDLLDPKVSTGFKLLGPSLRCLTDNLHFVLFQHYFFEVEMDDLTAFD